MSLIEWNIFMNLIRERMEILYVLLNEWTYYMYNWKNEKKIIYQDIFTSTCWLYHNFIHNIS